MQAVEGLSSPDAVELEQRLERRELALHILEMQVADVVDQIGDATAEILTALLEIHDEAVREGPVDRERLDALSMHALAEIQFEDRARQILNGVRKALALSAAEEARVRALANGDAMTSGDRPPFLDRAIFDTYVTENQRALHRGEGGEAPDAAHAKPPTLVLF